MTIQVIWKSGKMKKKWISEAILKNLSKIKKQLHLNEIFKIRILNYLLWRGKVSLTYFTNKLNDHFGKMNFRTYDKNHTAVGSNGNFQDLYAKVSSVTWKSSKNLPPRAIKEQYWKTPLGPGNKLDFKSTFQYFFKNRATVGLESKFQDLRTEVSSVTSWQFF